MKRATEIIQERIDSLSFFDGNFQEWMDHTIMLLSKLFGGSHKSLHQFHKIIKDLDVEYILDSIASDLYRQDEYNELKERVIQLLDVCINELEIVENIRTDSGEISPIDVNKFKTILLEKIPECDPVIIEFITEASKCIYYGNALLAATFMIGAASEKAILLLIEKYAENIQNPRNKERFRNRVNNRMVSVKYEEFTKSYSGCQNKPTDPILSQDLNTIIGNTFQFCRITRNQIGHPNIVPEANQDIVIANLGHIVVYIERIYGLMKHFDKNGVVL